jgi:SecD/SecF fusion protein
MTDAEVQKVIRRKVDESVESAFGVLRKELINLALLNLTFKIRESGQILVELPKDVDRIKKLLQSTAQLSFETYKIEEMGNFNGCK